MNSKFVTFSAVAALAAAFALADTAAARDQIRIVGSSTVYPFSTAVAEQFAKMAGAKPPVIEWTGTGRGIEIFCEGLGTDKVDIVNASRRMKKSEFEDCQKNGVKDIIEINIGFDGLTIAQSKVAASMKLSLAQLYLALAEQVPDKNGKLVDNPYKSWSDIAPSLLGTKIEVLGPPRTSGTRDSLHELLLEKGAEQILELATLQKSDNKAFDKAWKSIRKDGAYIEVGENDNVIVQKLEANRNAFGIFGYSFLEENLATLKAVALEGTEPNAETIASGKYKGSRRMYVYIKKAHIGMISGLDKFLAEHVSDKAMGKDGYLAREGLVTLPKAEFDAVKKAVGSMNTMRGDDFSS